MSRTKTVFRSHKESSVLTPRKNPSRLDKCVSVFSRLLVLADDKVQSGEESLTIGGYREAGSQEQGFFDKHSRAVSDISQESVLNILLIDMQDSCQSSMRAKMQKKFKNFDPA